MYSQQMNVAEEKSVIANIRDSIQSVYLTQTLSLLLINFIIFITITESLFTTWRSHGWVKKNIQYQNI